MQAHAERVRPPSDLGTTPRPGQSVLARPLATLLSLPLLSKDVIKEMLYGVLGHVADDEMASSRRLGGTVMELLWRLAGECPAVVLEANFRRQSRYERTRARTDLVPRGGGASGCCGRAVCQAWSDG